MPVSDFLPFAIAAGANVATQHEYATDPALGPGYASGQVQSHRVNKLWRQSSFVSAAIARMMMLQLDKDILDNGNLNDFTVKLSQTIINLGGVGGSGGGIPEAPTDGDTYGRCSLAWTAVVPEAPNDDIAYGRSNLAWIATVPISGATLTGPLILAADPVLSLEATTKKYVDNLLVFKASINSPSFTGTPTAPTAPNATNNQQIATCQFVANAIGLIPSSGVTNVTAGAGLAGGGTGAVTLSIATGGVTNAMHANSPPLTFKGNYLGTAGPPVDMTATQAGTLLGGPFLPLAGGTLTGGLLISGPTSGAFELSVPGTTQTSIWFTRTGAPADQRKWEVMSGSDGTFTIRTVNDAYSASTQAITIYRGPGVALGNLVFGTNIIVGPTGGWTVFALDKTAGTTANQISGRTAGVGRWDLQLGDSTAEAAGNVGSNFVLGRYANNGSWLGNALAIDRSTGNASFSNSLIVYGAITTGNIVISGSNSLTMNGVVHAVNDPLNAGYNKIYDNTGVPSIFLGGNATYVNNIYQQNVHIFADRTGAAMSLSAPGAFYVYDQRSVGGGVGGQVLLQGKNAAGTMVNYAGIGGYAIDGTAGSGTGNLVIRALNAGSFVDAAYIGFASSKFAGPVICTGVGAGLGQFHMAQGVGTGYGSMWYNDGGITYFLLTDNNNALGIFNSLRPFSVDNASGLISMNQGLAINTVGMNIYQGVLSGSRFSLYDDGNSHIESSTALWLNSNGGATTIGGPIQANSNLNVSGDIAVANAVSAANYQIMGMSATGAGTIGWSNSNGPYIVMYGNTSVGGGRMQLASGGTAGIWVATTIYPTPHAGIWLGYTGQSWYGVSSLNYLTDSDPSHKTDIHRMGSVLDRVNAIVPSTFRWKEGIDTARRHHGFLANDIRDVLGEDFGGWWKDEKTGRQSLAYNELTAVLWQAVRELSAQVTTLEDKVIALTGG